MQSKQELSLEEIRAFLKGSDEVHFEGQNREEIYGWVNETRELGFVREALQALPGASTHY